MFIETASGLVYGSLKRNGNFKRSQTFVTAILCGVVLFFNLVLFASSAGYYWLETVDHYATGINLVAFLFVQLIVLVYMLPISDLEKKVNSYGEKFPKWYDICLRYVCPVFALFLTFTAIANEFKRDHHYNNIFEIILSWIIFLTPTAFFVIFFFWNPFSAATTGNHTQFERMDRLLEE